GMNDHVMDHPLAEQAAGERLAAPGPAAAAPRPGTGLRRGTRRLPAAGTLAAAAFLLLLVAAALLAPWIAPFDPLAGDVLANLMPPSLGEGGEPAHLLGTDMLGRDVLSGILYGARVSLVVGLAAAGGAGVLGTAIGIVCGFFRGTLDEVLMRLVDIQLAFPFILLAVLIMYVLGQGLGNVIVVLVVATWPVYARVARAEAMRLRETDFVQAARAIGARPLRTLLRHVLPNAAAPLIVVATAAVPQMIIFEAALSFLGIGLPPTQVSWGSLLAAGRDYLDQAWWIATFPGIAIMLTILSANTLGDRLRQRLDPRGVRR
ncbi:MAG: ABC transporter permease, partial [Janthinobacterium lividum]